MAANGGSSLDEKLLGEIDRALANKAFRGEAT